MNVAFLLKWEFMDWKKIYIYICKMFGQTNTFHRTWPKLQRRLVWSEMKNKLVIDAKGDWG